jgi:hypothetical protein
MGLSCWNADPTKRPGIDHVLLTLEKAAEEWKPKSGGLSVIQNTPPTLDETVDQILAKAKSPLGEDEARGVIEMLEKVCGDHPKPLVGASDSWAQESKYCHDMALETRRRFFQRVVEICGEHSILPDSCITPKPRLQKQGDIPVSSDGPSVVWRGVYMENDDDKHRDVAIKVMRYSTEPAMSRK